MLHRLVFHRCVVCWIVVGCLAAVAGGCSDPVAPQSRPGVGSPAHPAVADVRVSNCASSSNHGDGPTAMLEIKNHSTKKSHYLIVVAFESADGTTQLDTTTAAVDNLEPGQRTQRTTTSHNPRVDAQPFRCVVNDVTRLSAVG